MRRKRIKKKNKEWELEIRRKDIMMIKIMTIDILKIRIKTSNLMKRINNNRMNKTMIISLQFYMTNSGSY